MTAENKRPTTTATASPRRLYSPPRLVHHGRLRSLTTSGTKNTPETGQGQPGKRV
jgi:hypothetical protein